MSETSLRAVLGLGTSSVLALGQGEGGGGPDQLLMPELSFFFFCSSGCETFVSECD